MPVEKFSVVDTHDGTTLVAVCHGNEEIVTVPDSVLREMVGSTFGFGEAFKENDNGRGTEYGI